MKACLMLIFFLISSMAVAENVEVELKPESPVVNEPYELVFTIEITGDEKPYISFDPGKARVTERERQGVSVKTTVVNGRFTTKKTVTYAYRMMTDNEGIHFLKDIKVEVGDQTHEVSTKKYKVLKEAPRPKSIFLRAEVSDKEVYLGEGIDVRYYLYYRRQVVGREIAEFPKLNKFIKRFHKIQDEIETVEHKGEVYRRLLVYSARLYPQNVGTAYVDPIRVKVQYSRQKRGNNRGFFGLQMQDYMTRNLSSKKIPIEVKKLPAKDVPASFTGLVGKHEFSFSDFNGQYVINEPIELTLEVVGPGALENLSPPSVYEHKALEEFDTKSDLSEIGRSKGKKVFEYTFLGRQQVNLTDQKFQYSYFDPDSEEYVEKSLPLPDLIVKGGGGSSDSSTEEDSSSATLAQQQEQTETKQTIPPQSPAKLLAPEFSRLEGSMVANGIVYLNYLLAVIIVMLFGWPYILRGYVGGRQREALKIVAEINRKGISYSRLYSLISLLNNVDETLMGLKDIVDSSSMDEGAKSYFKNLIDEYESGTFYRHEKKSKEKLKKRYVKKLLKAIRGNDESTRESGPVIGAPS